MDVRNYTPAAAYLLECVFIWMHNIFAMQLCVAFLSLFCARGHLILSRRQPIKFSAELLHPIFHVHSIEWVWERESEYKNTATAIITTTAAVIVVVAE